MVVYERRAGRLTVKPAGKLNSADRSSTSGFHRKGGYGLTDRFRARGWSLQRPAAADASCSQDHLLTYLLTYLLHLGSTSRNIPPWQNRESQTQQEEASRSKSSTRTHTHTHTHTPIQENLEKRSSHRAPSQCCIRTLVGSR